MRHRKIRNRRNRGKKQKKIIIISTLILMFFFTVGYGAFQTIISINVKGNIKVTPDECFTVSDNGNGTGTITNYSEECGTKVKIPVKLII